MANLGYLASGLFAAGASTQVGAYQMSSVAYINQFLEVTADNNSCLLPLNPPNGLICKVRNDSSTALPLFIYPQIGGAINNLANNIPYILPVECMAEFVALNGEDWILSYSSYSTGFNAANLFFLTEIIDDQEGDEYDISSASAGNVFLINTQTAAFTINLPSPLDLAGAHFLFEIIGDTAGFDIEIIPYPGTFYGSLINSIPDGVTCIPCNAKESITFLAASTFGSSLQLICDGTNYLAYGVGTLDNANWA